MNKLYNKILNEVYLIQNFDSWDNSESEFKETVQSSLKSFIYTFQINAADSAACYAPEPYYTHLCIFNSDWSLYFYYKDKVSVDGKKVKLRKHIGWTDNEYLYEPNKKFSVVIDNLNGLEDCEKMFAHTGIISLPLFDTSDCLLMSCMFAHCPYLIECPQFDVKNCEVFSEMFAYCWKLENVPMFKNFTWAKYVDRSPLFPAPDKYGNNMFLDCVSLNEQTRKIWKTGPGEDDATPDWFIPKSALNDL